MLIWSLAEVAIALLISAVTTVGRCVILFLIAYRVIDIVQAAVNLTVFAPLRYGPSKYNITNAARALMLTLWSYVELAFLFGIIYSTSPSLLRHSSQWWDPYYFSAISQLTIGYGDIQPTGIFKVMAPLQGTLGFVLAVIAISRLVTLLPQPKEVAGPPE